MCSLVRLASATHQFALMFPPRRALAGWLMCFHLPGRLHCLAMSRLLDPLPSCFQWYLHFSPPSASHSWELMGGDWSLHPTVALHRRQGRPGSRSAVSAGLSETSGGLPWWSSGQDSVSPVLRGLSLAREPDPTRHY